MRPPARLLSTALAVLLLAACGGGSGPGSVGSASPAPSSSGIGPLQASLRPVPGIPVAGSPPRNGVPWYLAIGDSITFGYTLDRSRWNGRNSSWALQLQDLLAASGRPWQLYDTACPSETLATYRTRCPQRQMVPFLAATSQHDAAMTAIREHGRDLRLILVALGSNDLLHAQRHGGQLPDVTATLRAGLGGVLTELTAAAPGVPIVVANFYDPFENLQPDTVPEVQAVNLVVQGLAETVHARVADFFAVVNTPTPPARSLCTYVDCAHLDIHPTIAGQAALARAALRAIDA